MTIADKSKRGNLAFDLADILRLLEPGLSNSEWTISGLECVGDTANDLQAHADRGDRLSGTELLRLASSLTQTIDGIFTGYCSAPEPWVIIRAVDSSVFDVASADKRLLQRVRAAFKNVTDPADINGDSVT